MPRRLGLVYCFVLLASGAAAEPEDQMVNDFVEVCLKHMPDVEAAIGGASHQDFIAISEGDRPELDKYFGQMWQNDPQFVAIKMYLEDEKFGILMVGDKAISNVRYGACAIQLIRANPDLLAKSISAFFRVEEPALDIVNSGERLRSWNTFVDGHVQPVVLNDLTYNQHAVGAKITVAAPHISE